MDSDINCKASLNGTWFLADESVKILDNMMIRVGTTTFEASIKNGSW